MKIGKIIGAVLVVYVLIVVAFESWLGYSQPAGETSLVITTTDEDGNRHTRVVTPIETEGKLYVAANHWPRAWFNQALANPNVEATYKGETNAYRAVRISGEEHERVDAARPLGPMIRFLTGFPPRYFVRLDPRAS